MKTFQEIDRTQVSTEASRLKAFLREKSYGDLAALSEATGINLRTLRSWLMPSGNPESIPLGNLLKILHALGDDPVEVLNEAINFEKDKEEAEPVEEMEQLEDPALTLHNAHMPVPRDEYLENVGLFIECVERTPVELTGEWRFFLDPVAREIDKLREQDRNEALWKARASLTALMSDDRERFRFEDPETFSCYVARLGALGSVHRTLGQYQLAAIAIKKALRFLRPSQYRTVVGADLFMKAAAVLRDLQLVKESIPVLLAAHSVMSAGGRAEDSTMALYAVATRWRYLGRKRKARAALETCRVSPRTADVEIGIRNFDAKTAMEARDFQTARAELGAILAASPPARSRAMVLWRLAVCEGMDKPGSEASIEAFQEALQVARANLEPADLFFLFFDFSEMLNREGQLETLAREADKLIDDLPKLGVGTHTWFIAKDFIEQASSAGLACSVSDARVAFEKSRN